MIAAKKLEDPDMEDMEILIEIVSKTGRRRLADGVSIKITLVKKSDKAARGSHSQPSKSENRVLSSDRNPIDTLARQIRESEEESAPGSKADDSGEQVDESTGESSSAKSESSSSEKESGISRWIWALLTAFVLFVGGYLLKRTIFKPVEKKFFGL